MEKQWNMHRKLALYQDLLHTLHGFMCMCHLQQAPAPTTAPEALLHNAIALLAWLVGAKRV